MTDPDLQVDPEDNQTPEVPDWIPEKFRTAPEKFGEAYTNLERELTQRGQRERELQQQIEHYEGLLATAQQPAQQQYDPSADPLVVAYEAAYEQGDTRAMLALQAQLASQVANQAVQNALPQVAQQYQQSSEAQAGLVAEMAWNNLTSRYGDGLEQHRDQIYQAIQDQPWLIPDAAARDPQTAARAIENVYKMVNPAAFVTGTTPDMTAAKLAAQGLPGAAGRPPSPDAAKAEWDAIKKAAENEPGRYW